MDITRVSETTLPWAVDCGIHYYNKPSQIHKQGFSLFSYIRKIRIFISKYPDFRLP